MTELTPTRSVLLTLKDDRQAMREAYGFLDEKRTLLAAEIIAQLRHYQGLRARQDEAMTRARAALRGAIAWHGLEGVQWAPKAAHYPADLVTTERSLLGVRVVDITLERHQPEPSGITDFPAIAHCQRAFFDLIEAGTAMAAVIGNLTRLYEEYRRTERQTRSLEDVLLPELNSQIREVEGRLEEGELEEAVRARPRRQMDA